MTQTDPLMAVLRQLAAAKTGSRAAPHMPIAKDGKGKVDDGKSKVEQFRDQLRSLAANAKHGPKQQDAVKQDAIKKDIEPEPVPDAELADEVAQVLDRPPPTRSKDRTRSQVHERGATDNAPAPQQWHAPDAGLAFVKSMVAQLHARTEPHQEEPSRVAPPRAHVEVETPDISLATPTKAAKTDASPEPRVTFSVNAAETRAGAPPIKVAVREQETHFPPVAQPTLLQKIVDRLAPEIAATPAPPAPSPAADAALTDVRRTVDTPVKMLTLQLDPPSMGTVVVRMRLTGDSVEVRLTADRQDTMKLLQEERGALKDAMQSAGYSFDIASIDQSAAADPNQGATAGQSHARSEQQQGQQSQSGTQTNGGGGGNSGWERQSNDTQAGARQNRRGHEQIVQPAERPQAEEPVRGNNSGTRYL